LRAPSASKPRTHAAALCERASCLGAVAAIYLKRRIS